MADLISRAAAIEICKSIVPNTNPDFYNLEGVIIHHCDMMPTSEAEAREKLGIEPKVV